VTAPRHPSRLQTPFGNFDLARYPAGAGQTLLPWCAADTLLLEEIHRREIPGSNILVVNDSQGALCVALEPRALWTDSALAVLALRRNEAANSRGETAIVWSTDTPAFTPEVVVLRVPKQLSFLEYQLSQLARCLPTGATVLAAGMDKHLSPNTAQVLERFIGPTQRHPGQRKARLFSATKADLPVPDVIGTAKYFCPELAAELEGLPNVFSRENLDIGTRFLLSQLHCLAPAQTIVDLACGNGILGLVALRRGLAERVVFCDESALAIASAQGNAKRIFPQQQRQFLFHHGDGLLAYRGEPVELILCNPPFHQEHTVNELAGQHLLLQCGRHLQPGGRLCLVANNNLNYLPTLRRVCHRVERLASNARFNIFLAHKT
jgi:23S rRNA (guanine1835-N2)-methyltransferase